MPLPLGFVVHKEERFVFLDRSTECGAKLIEIELLLEGSEVTLGVKLGIPQVLVKSSVKLVAARFCRYQHGWTRARSVLGRVVVSQNFEFLHGVNRRQNRDATRGELVVVVVVEQPIGALGARSSNGERVGSAGRCFAAGRAIEKAVGIRFLRCSRRECGQLHEVASVQRKVRHLFGGNDLSERRVRGFNRHFRRGHFHGR